MNEEPAGLDHRVSAALRRCRQIRGVRLVGSRAAGTARPLSDWDFEIDTEDFALVAREMPGLVEELDPICKQWDRLSDTWCYMLLLRGPVKVDLIFDEPHRHSGPWFVSSDTLAAIDAHFWDWILWFSSKEAMGKTELVSDELASMHEHLLEPMGAVLPASVETAIGAYLDARGQAEERFNLSVPRDAEVEVLAAVRQHPGSDA